VPDHKVFNRLLEETNLATQPFFNVMFSLSSHEPFEVPMETVIPGNSNKERHMNSVYYTDKSLGAFIEQAKQQPWWDNTLVVLVADHASRIDGMTYFDRDRHHIPMIWLGGALSVKDTVINKYGVHSDISVTLLNQLSVPHQGYLYGKDLLNNGSQSFAFYSCTYGAAFVSDSLYLMYDITSDSYLQDDAKASDMDRDLLKAYLQVLYADFAKK
jgi:phosphoglycerol transferase MdoB-like AlkP superfamily enzyme